MNLSVGTPAGDLIFRLHLCPLRPHRETWLFQSQARLCKSVTIVENSNETGFKAPISMDFRIFVHGEQYNSGRKDRPMCILYRMYSRHKTEDLEHNDWYQNPTVAGVSTMEDNEENVTRPALGWAAPPDIRRIGLGVVIGGRRAGFTGFDLGLRDGTQLTRPCIWCEIGGA